MPAAMRVPPAGPSTARITAAAGADVAASPPGPSTRRYATFASRYMATTTATPSTSARGRFRSGSMISSAMKLVCCQPPYVNRMGTRAAPSVTATCAAVEGGGGRSRAVKLTAERPATMSAARAASFKTVKMFWVTAAGFTPT